MRKMIFAALAGAPLLVSSLAFAEPQPHMVASIEHLKQAKAELEKAWHNKGGHREEGIKMIDAAIHQCEEGIRYANEHHDEHP